MNSRQRPRRESVTPRRVRHVRPGLRVLLRQFVVSGRIVSALLLLGVVYWAVLMGWSDRYVVRRVLVSGAIVLSESRINDMVAVSGMSIWAVNPTHIETVLAQSPYVMNVSVQVQLPDTVQISLTEQQSEVRWKNGEWYLIVDDSGLIVGVDSSVVLTNTLVINDDSRQSLSEGDAVDATVLNMAKTVNLRLPAETNLQITRMGWDMRRGLTVNTQAGQLILFGDAQDLDAKIQILHELQVRNVEFVFVDLRSQTPYYRYDIPPQALVATIDVVSDTTVLTDTNVLDGAQESVRP